MTGNGRQSESGDRLNVAESLRERYYSGVEAGALAGAVIVVVLTVVLWNRVPRTSLLAWTAAMMVAFPLPPLVKRAELDIRIWRYFAYPLEFLHGVLWGSLPAFLMPPDPIFLGVVSAVAVGVLLGGSVSSSQFLPAFAFFTTPLALMSAYGFATSALEGAIVLTWLMLVAWVYGTSVVFDQRRLHLDLVKAARDNEELVAELEAERASLASAAAEADRMARTDALTGLANRLRFDEFLSAELARLDLGVVDRVTLAYLDIDSFKRINDRSGHRAGDMLLSSVAQRLGAVAQTGELIARIGGDELVVVSTSSDPASLGERIRQVFDPPFALGPVTIAVTASIGVASTETGIDADELIKRSDTVQYEAKRGGGGRVVLAEPVGAPSSF